MTVVNMELNKTHIPKHHVRQEVCTTRPSYRDGRRLTSVKVYTVHQESKYLLIQNVPAVGAKDQLAKLLSTYGTIEDLHPLDEYPAEKFTEVFLVKFQRIQSARFAKKKLDDCSFFGGSLHICYAPEYETVRETREKLQDRRKVIAAKVRKLESQSESSMLTNCKPASSSDGRQLSLPSSQQPLELPPPSSSLPQPPPPPPAAPPPPPPPPRMSLLPLDSPVTGPSSSHGTVFHQTSYKPPQNARTATGTLRPNVHPHRFSPHHVEWNGQEDSTVRTTDQTFDTITFQIPLPPKPGISFDASQYKLPHCAKKDYGFAWVPSANSTFPPGYDPRLPQVNGEGPKEGESHFSSEDQAGTCVTSLSCDKKTGEDIVPPASGTSSSQQLVAHFPVSQSSERDPKMCANTPGGGSGKVVVKQYKPKGLPPRFVPRQIKERKDKESEAANKSLKSNPAKAKKDEVNSEIRREAFRLEEDQGPALPSDPEMREQLLGQRPLVEPKVEASVVASVKAIRKRMSMFIAETVPKKLKMNPQSDKQLSKTSVSDGDTLSAD